MIQFILDHLLHYWIINMIISINEINNNKQETFKSHI